MIFLLPSKFGLQISVSITGFMLFFGFSYPAVNCRDLDPGVDGPDQ